MLVKHQTHYSIEYLVDDESDDKQNNYDDSPKNQPMHKSDKNKILKSKK